MKQILSILFLFLPLVMSAQSIVSETTSHSQTPEAHLFATFVKSFKHGLSLTLEEEIRSILIFMRAIRSNSMVIKDGLILTSSYAIVRISC